MNLNRFYFTMTLILVTVLLTNYVSAVEQLDNEGPIYGECKYYTETVIENGFLVALRGMLWWQNCETVVKNCPPVSKL